MYETILYENNTYYSLLSIYESNDHPIFFKFEGHIKYIKNRFELVRKSVIYRGITSDMYIIVFRKGFRYGVPFIKDDFLYKIYSI